MSYVVAELDHQLRSVGLFIRYGGMFGGNLICIYISKTDRRVESFSEIQFLILDAENGGSMKYVSYNKNPWKIVGSNMNITS